MAVQKSMDRRDLLWYAVSSYASELNDSGKSRLSGNDIQSLIEYEKTEKQFSQSEQNILRGIYWRMHYHFDEFESDIEFVSNHLREIDSTPFDSPITAPILDQSHIEEKFDESQFSTAQIESMLELGRFLHRNGFKLKDRDSALRFVDKLISSDFIRQSTLDSLNADNRAEFQSLLDRCTQSSKSKPTQTIQEVYLKLVEKISKIFRASQIPILGDVDDFIWKLATLNDFRDNILKNIHVRKERDKIIRYCELILKNERKDDSINE